MKLVATFLVAIFVVVASMSLAFADCAGHSKAQLVKNETNQTQEQISTDRVATTEPLPAVSAKVAQSVKADKALEKK
jgi:hypothetical protein